jgi:transcriptional regulator with XRE-family HTH domain
VSKLAILKRSKLPPAEIAVAERLRDVREGHHFSLAELAVQCDVSKSALGHYEYGRAPLPFDVGNRICEQFNISQRWLALGSLPVGTFLDLSALQLDSKMEAAARKLTFFEAYSELLKARVEAALAIPKQPSLRQKGDPPGWFRSSTTARLESVLANWVKWLRHQTETDEKLATAELVEQTLSELRSRYCKKKAFDQNPALQDLSAMELSERLQKTRKKLGLTQAEAAKKWGVPKKTLESWEYGKRKPRGLALKQLMTILREARQSSD